MTIAVPSFVATIPDLLRVRAAEQPHDRVYTFLGEDGAERASLTYAQLEQRARRIAAALQERRAQGERVLLLYPPGLEYITAFYGCLMAGAIAVPAYPPRQNRHVERLEAILRDAQARHILTSNGIAAKLEGFDRLSTDALPDAPFLDVTIQPDDVAFLQYTSGSTSTPKGVRVTHANLLHNEEAIRRAFGVEASSVVVGWLPLYHDMGLIGNVLQPLYAGATAVLMSPIAFLQRPMLWLETISRQRGTISGGPNFAYELVARAVRDEEKAELDLSSWHLAFNGAEPVRAETLERFGDTFAPCGFRREAFYPCYGLAEATLFVSGRSGARVEAGRVSCGAAGEGIDVRIVDAAGDVAPEGAVGEIAVAGPSVAAGYWRRPEESAETFGARISGDSRTWLRTGDLGVLHGGELFVAGRVKDLIIIRGRNHYPQDIERTVERAHPALRAGGGAAFAIEEDGREQLVIVHELAERASDAEAVFESIRAAVAEEHELAPFEIVLIRRGTLPKTSSGKVQRRACRDLYQRGALQVIASSRAGSERSALDESTPLAWLRADVAARAGVGVESIDVDRAAIRYGIDSLTAIEWTHALESRFGVRTSIATILGGATLAEIAAGAETARKWVVMEDTALTPGERALLFLQQLAPENVAYNIAASFDVPTEIDVARLRDAIAALVRRHAALRKAFAADRAIVHEEVDGWWLDDARNVDAPFDVTRAPLFRVAMEGRVLHVVFHHLICDFRSLAVLARELTDVYDGRPLPPVAPRVSHADGDDTFWRAELDGAPFVLDLPTDRPRPRLQSDRGDARSLHLDRATSQRLEAIARETGATLQATLLAAFEQLLARFSGQEDFLVGLPYAGRDAKESANTVGYLVNTILHRARIEREATFADQLSKTQRELAAALAHASYPFPLLVESLQPQRDPSRSPLFQAMFVFQSGDDDLARISHGEAGAKLPLGDAHLLSRAPSRHHAQFDLTLRAARLRVGIALSLEINADLFDGTTGERMLDQLRMILDGIADGPRRPLGELSRLTLAEAAAIDAWNATAQPYDLSRPLHEHFVRSGTLTFEDETISYDELYRRADVQAATIAPGTIVPVVRERSIELMVELVAILKASAAYLPIDPDAPQRRREALIAEARGAGKSAAECAYVIYTSGSTGRPKGVINTHRGIVNRLLWMQETFGLRADDAVLQKTPYTFDVSVWELFWPLMTGARLVIAKPDGHRDPAYLVDVIERERITTIHFVPSMLQQFLLEPELGRRCASLRRVICSGEALPPELAQRTFERLPHVELHNLYGPTEAAVDVTWWQCKRGERTVPIGRPIANTTCAILDRDLRPAPIGAAGELYLGGIQLARGYLARPDLTAERFVPAPNGERLYRTGDLARWRPDGAIEYLGRTDHQVKVRGVRIELGEIEAALRQHARVRDAVVIARTHAPRASSYRVTERLPGKMTEFRLFLKAGEAEETRDTALIAYVIGEVAASELRAHLQEHLPPSMIPAAFVVLEAFPLTSSGKVDRNRLPAPEVVRERAYVAPRDAAEMRMAALWLEVLRVESVGAEDNFFELGGDSIRALQLRARGEEEGIRFALQDVFTHQTPAALARVATFDVAGEEIALTRPFSLVTAEDRARVPESIVDAYPLSRVQAGLIYHLDLDPETAIYHDVFVYSLRARFDEAAFRRAAQEVVDRHPILRTAFDMANYSEPLQLVYANVPASVEVLDFRGRVEEQRAWIEREKQEPVDLTRHSQMRFVIHRMTDDEFQLVLSFYDTILDGWSTATLLTELLTRYAAALNGAPLPPAAPPRVTYRDFVALERRELVSEETRAFWSRTLDEAEVTRVPRSGAPTEGKRVIVSVDVPVSAETSQRLKEVARLAGTPLKHVLLAAHLRVVSFLSGQRDIVTGLESNGRLEHADGEQSLGIHINTLPMRHVLHGGTWLELIRDAFANERELLPHRRTPLFDLLKERGRQDLFETVFNYTHFHVFQALASIDGIEVLGAWGFEETNFDLRAEFNRNPFTDRVQLDVVANLGTLTRAQVEEIAAFYARTLETIARDAHGRYEMTPSVSREVVRRSGAESALNLRANEVVALRFGDAMLTYAELDARSTLLARALRANGAGPDVPVALSMERGIDAIVALLAIVKSGSAVLPLDPAYPRARRDAMLAASGASIVVDGTRTLGGDAELPRIEPDHLLYLIYTSGSTGTPKGVAMTHRALADLVAWQAPRFADDERILQFASLSFDVAYQEIFTAFAVGGTLVLVEEETRRDPHALLAHIERHEVTRVFLPFVALKGLVDAASESGRFPRALRSVITAGEALEISPNMRRFFDAIPGCTLENQYGPSETHVVTAHELPPDTSSWPALPPIGVPVANADAVVLDAFLQPVPDGTAGELYLGGSCLARGYLHDPAHTAERFVPDPAGNGARLYRSGDLARRRYDGLLDFLGRADAQVKIRGFRVEPGEIDAMLAAHPDVARSVTVARDLGGANRLVSYVQSPAAAHELRAWLAARLPEYMIPTAFVAVDAFPLTPSGKIDRRALPDPQLASMALSREIAAPRNGTEEIVAGLWLSVLGVNEVGREESFFDLGGDSLLATQLVSRVRRTFSVDYPLRALFAEPTLAAMARHIETLRGVAREPIAPREGSGPDAPLSLAQQRLWFLSRLDPDSRAYANPIVIHIDGTVDIERFRRAVETVAQRHEILRTTFHEVDGQPVQRLHASLPIAIEEHDGRVEDLVQNESQRGFNLGRGPLLRIVFAVDSVVATLHHIISDGWSMGLLIAEIAKAYDDEDDLAPLSLQYADFAVWQRGQSFEAQLQWWRVTLAASQEVELPLDHPRPDVPSGRGARVFMDIDAELTRALDRRARREGATLFMLLLAAWNVIVATHASTDDVVIGTDVANRNREELEPLIGFFVNQLVLRTSLAGDPTLRELLERVRETALAAYDRQDVPFDLVVDAVNPARYRNRTPLFQSKLVLQNAPLPSLSLGDAKLDVVHVDAGTSKFDLLIDVWRTGDGLRASFEYAVDLFERTTIEQWARQWVDVLRALAFEPERRVQAMRERFQARAAEERRQARRARFGGRGEGW